VVRTSDESIAHPSHGAEVEIIKMHGCLTRSNHEDIVITKEDYEDFFYRRPATAERLRIDLLGRTFLFIGYGFGDPNIENIVVEARRLAKNATRKHHLVQLKVENSIDGGQRALRQKLWANDLRRIGIECTLIDDYHELQEILNEIALRSRGSTLYVTGSHESSNPLATEIGIHLAKLTSPEVTIVDGQSTGLSRDVITAVMEECVNRKVDLRARLMIHPNPYAANPGFSNDIRLLPILKTWRRTLLRSAQAVLAFDGSMGTEMEVELALSLGCRVIPVPIKAGGFADLLLSNPFIADPIQAKYPDYLTRWKNGDPITAEDVALCVGAMLK
jgi:predicted Rossmann-fold nucleotide-binding protein